MRGWLRAGIRLYHARRLEPAYRILKKAYEKRAEFTAGSRAELARYFCLSATRNRRYPEAKNVITLLEGAHQTKGMAVFLQADLLEHQREFGKAVAKYLESLELNRDMRSRLERTYRPLIWCMLHLSDPQYEQAAKLADDSLRINRTVFSLMTVARVYLHWRYRGARTDVPGDIDKRYRDALDALEKHPGVGSAAFELKAEEARFLGDFDEALIYMDQACEAAPRFELQAERWRIMVESGQQRLAQQVLEEMDAAKNNTGYRGNWQPFLPRLAETYARALMTTDQPLASVNRFAPELGSDEIGPIVARVKRTRASAPVSRIGQNGR